MREIKYRKEFYAFLKEKGLYYAYLATFQRESKLATIDRWNSREETDIKSFLCAIEPTQWVVMAFNWGKSKLTFSKWSMLHEEWYRYFNNNLNNEKTVNVNSVDSTDNSTISNNY